MPPSGPCHCDRAKSSPEWVPIHIHRERIPSCTGYDRFPRFSSRICPSSAFPIYFVSVKGDTCHSVPSGSRNCKPITLDTPFEPFLQLFLISGSLMVIYGDFRSRDATGSSFGPDFWAEILKRFLAMLLLYSFLHWSLYPWYILVNMARRFYRFLHVWSLYLEFQRKYFFVHCFPPVQRAKNVDVIFVEFVIAREWNFSGVSLGKMIQRVGENDFMIYCFPLLLGFFFYSISVRE